MDGGRLPADRLLPDLRPRGAQGINLRQIPSPETVHHHKTFLLLIDGVSDAMRNMCGFQSILGISLTCGNLMQDGTYLSLENTAAGLHGASAHQWRPVGVEQADVLKGREQNPS